MELWVARNKDTNELWGYTDKPLLDDDMYKMDYSLENTSSYELPSDWFPNVTFENSPCKVELRIVEEIIDVEKSPLKIFPRVNVFETGASYRR